MNNPTNCAGRAITTGVRDLAVADLRTNPSDKAARHAVPSALPKIGAQDFRTPGLRRAAPLGRAGSSRPSSGCVVWV